jgi:hypothetical protein
MGKIDLASVGPIPRSPSGETWYSPSATLTRAYFLSSDRRQTT